MRSETAHLRRHAGLVLELTRQLRENGNAALADQFDEQVRRYLALAQRLETALDNRSKPAGRRSASSSIDENDNAKKKGKLR